MNEITPILANPVTVLVDEKAYSDFYAKMKAECDAFVPDLSTAASRARISAQAYKVTRTKTAIDAAGKKLNEDARAKINAVDAQRRKIRDELDELATEVRKPLTEWESAEEKRVEAMAAVRATLDRLSVIGADDGSNLISNRIGEVEAVVIDPAVFLDETGPAKMDRQKIVADLTAARTRALKHEADQAELARLRQEAEQRAAEEARRAQEEAAARAETERKARAAAQHREYIQAIIKHIRDVGRGMIGGVAYPLPVLFRELEEKIVIDDSFGALREEAETALRDATTNLKKAEADQQAKAEAAREAEAKAREERAAEAARQAAAREAEAEQRRKDAKAAKVRAEHEAKIARLEAEKKAAAEAVAREQAERAAAAEKLKREEEARAADRKHRGDIMAAAKAAIVALGVGAEPAKKIVLAIVAGEIPHVTLRF